VHVSSSEYHPKEIGDLHHTGSCHRRGYGSLSPFDDIKSAKASQIDQSDFGMGLTNLSVSAAALSTGPTPNSTTDTVSPAPGVVIPVYSSWFNYDQVHDIERRSVPEFFDRPERERLYREYRDFMVSQYRGRPHEYLSMTMCRRHLTGDVGGIVRVHTFLEQWGLINFQTDIPPAKRERMVHVPVANELPPALSNALQAASMQFGNPTIPLKRDIKIVCPCGSDCSRYYYTYAPAAENSTVNLCALCYAEGKFPSGVSGNDFVKVDAKAIEQSMRVEWTEEDLVRLLSAVEEKPGDWDAVAKRVGRPKDQCIFHFLKLPGIEGLAAETIVHTGDQLGKSTPVHAIPFSTADNPVMAMLTFLASAVHPKVAAAAAQAAIDGATKLRAACKGEHVDQGNAMQGDEAESNATPIVPDHDDLEQIAATSIACAAVRAAHFVDEEQKKMARLRDTLVDLQLQKVRVKMSLYEDLERGLEEDRKELEQQRLQLFFDRFNLKRQMMSMEQKAGLTDAPTADEQDKLKIVDRADTPISVERSDGGSSPNDLTKL